MSERLSSFLMYDFHGGDFKVEEDTWHTGDTVSCDDPVRALFLV